MFKKIYFSDIIPDLESFFPQSDLSIIRVIPPRPDPLNRDFKKLFEMHKEGALVLDSDGKIDLTPTVIAQFSKENDFNLKWENIPDWDAFESGFEISNKDMLDFIFKDKLNLKGDLIIISQESTNNFEGFQIQAPNLLSFIDEIYFEEFDFDYEFFGGRQNLIFISMEQKTITLFSHRGIYTHIECFREQY